MPFQNNTFININCKIKKKMDLKIQLSYHYDILLVVNYHNETFSFVIVRQDIVV